MPPRAGHYSTRLSRICELRLSCHTAQFRRTGMPSRQWLGVYSALGLSQGVNPPHAFGAASKSIEETQMQTRLSSAALLAGLLAATLPGREARRVRFCLARRFRGVRRLCRCRRGQFGRQPGDDHRQPGRHDLFQRHADGGRRFAHRPVDPRCTTAAPGRGSCPARRRFRSPGIRARTRPSRR